MSIMVGLFCASIGKQGLIASESIEGEKIYNETQEGRRSAVQILRMRRARPTAVRRINNSVGFPYCTRGLIQEILVEGCKHYVR